MNRIEQAYELVRGHRPADAVALLEEGGRAGDAACWVELATWHLGGSIIPRDLARCRECFRLAGEGGHDQARSIYISLLANGTGGPAEWSSAVGELREFGSHNADAARQVMLLEAMALGSGGEPGPLPAPHVLSESPKALLFSGLLSEDECRYLVDRALPLLQPSAIVDPATGRMRPHPIRTSEGAAFPWIDENPVIHAINRRIAAASASEVRAGEPLQVLRYRPGQEYRPHHDAVPGTDNQRVLTMLVYLNDGYAGGETVFFANGLKVRGAPGDALLFRNALDDGTPDPAAQHAGLPVTSGEKLIASRWIRQRAFGPAR